MLRFQVHHPQLAGVENPDSDFFYAALTDCQTFYLQPFRNESTILENLQQIEALEVEIHEGSPDGDRVKVFCAHRGVSNGARLSLRAANFNVWNQDFDPMEQEDLLDLRKRLNPSDESNN